jgi:endonuclease/exonuclease/phosphatase family metal-dependent hydrolase
MDAADDTSEQHLSASAGALLRVATWNLEWAQAGTQRGDRVAKVLRDLADVMVVTECELGSLPQGHTVDAGDAWGYVVPRPGRRKVALWSRHGWTNVDRFKEAGLPPGRLVAAATNTPLGPLNVIGVCIPWRGAHVSTGRNDRAPWQDHAAFLEQLPQVLRTVDGPFVLAGDFNQRLPRSRQPAELADLLQRALQGLDVPTAGDTPLGRLIDHIAVGPGLRASGLQLIPQRNSDGRLSDHAGASVNLHRS